MPVQLSDHRPSRVLTSATHVYNTPCSRHIFPKRNTRTIQQGYTRYEAKIGYTNSASLKLFADAGFVEKRRVDAFQEVTMALEVDAGYSEVLKGLLSKQVQIEQYDDG